MTSNETRIIDNSMKSPPISMESPPEEPPSPEDDVVRSIPRGMVIYTKIRVELKQKGGIKQFHTCQRMGEIVDAITALGETAVVKIGSNYRDAPILQIPKELSRNGAYKEYFHVVLQNNRAFRKINVIFEVVSDKNFEEIKRGVSEYLNNENIVMHEHLFQSKEVHHCGYFTGLEPGKTDTKMLAQYVTYISGVKDVQVVKGPLFHKDENGKWVKNDLLAVLSEPEEADLVSKKLLKETSHRDRGLEYIDSKAIVYNPETVSGLPTLVEIHKDQLKKQTTIVIDEIDEDDQDIIGEIMELESVIFINRSRAIENSLVVITNKDKKMKTEQDIITILKKHRSNNEIGRPFLRHNDPDAPERTVPKKPTKVDNSQQVKFDDDEQKYINMIMEVINKKKHQKTKQNPNGESTEPSTTMKPQEKNRPELEDKLEKKIREKKNRRVRIITKPVVMTNLDYERKSTVQDKEENADTDETMAEAPPTPQIKTFVKDSWEDEDDTETQILSPLKTPTKNLLGSIEKETSQPEDKESEEQANNIDADKLNDNETNDGKDENVRDSSKGEKGKNKRDASKSPYKDDYAEWTPAKRFVPKKNKQVRVLSPYQFLTKPKNLPNLHGGRGGGGPIKPSATSGTSTTDAGGLVRGGGI